MMKRSYRIVFIAVCVSLLSISCAQNTESIDEVLIDEPVSPMEETEVYEEWTALEEVPAVDEGGVIEEESGEGVLPEEETAFDVVYNEIPVDDSGIHQISYEQFMTIKNAQDDFILLDTREEQLYNEGHIEGARSFFVQDMTPDSIGAELPEGSSIIVYHQNVSHPKSNRAAEKLDKYGYKVLNFKNGIKEWIERGHNVVR